MVRPILAEPITNIIFYGATNLSTNKMWLLTLRVLNSGLKTKVPMIECWILNEALNLSWPIFLPTGGI